MTGAAIRRAGFIGLGVMGEAMCQNLVRKGGWPITVHDLNPEPLARIAADGAAVAGSAAEVADAADLVILCLPGGEEVRRLTLGPDGLVARLRPGQILVDMSTSQPALARELAAACATRGARFADAPVARTRAAAVEGKLAIMVGADAELLEDIRPALATMGTDILHCGGPGAGQTAKVMNNMVLFQTVAALAEALTMSERSGVDGRVLLETLSQGSADSFALRNHGMNSLLPGDYAEKAFSVRYAAKDLISRRHDRAIAITPSKT